MEALTETVEVAREVFRKAEARAKALRAMQHLLEGQIDDAAAETKAGNVLGSRQLAALAVEKLETDKALKGAELELRDARTSLDHVIDVDRRQQFNTCTSQARLAKTEFIAQFRQLCLTFGDYCVNMQKAITLANELGASLGGAFPHDTVVIRELERDLNPYEKWPSVKPHAGWGCELNLARVAPMKAEF